MVFILVFACSISAVVATPESSDVDVNIHGSDVHDGTQDDIYATIQESDVDVNIHGNDVYDGTPDDIYAAIQEGRDKAPDNSTVYVASLRNYSRRNR